MMGGGTTSRGREKNGDFVSPGCLYLGARHIKVVPGTYRIVELSPYARRLLQHLGIDKDQGAELARDEVEAVLDFYVLLLEAALIGRHSVFEEPVARLHQQGAFRPRPLSRSSDPVAVATSVGVG